MTREAIRFVATAGAWVVALFGLSRLPWIQQWLLVPLLRAQQQVALWHAGGRASVVVTEACSGADVIALCLASTLAYPVRWRRRLAGAAGGLALILALNTLRIGTLSAFAGQPLFMPLHVYVWPTVLVLATLAYVGVWMWTADAPRPGRGRLLVFGATTAGMVCLYLALTPALYASGALRHVAQVVTGGAALLMSGVGLAAQAHGSVLRTAHGAFVVTPECITTPLMPVYLAAVLTLPRTWRGRALGVVAFLPLFGLLVSARLFTLAVPPFLSRSPMVAIHGFHQLTLGVALVLAAAWWMARQGGRSLLSRTAAAAAVSVAALALAGPYNATLTFEARSLQVLVPHALDVLSAPGDVQGALLLLPTYQLWLFAALVVVAAGRWRPSLLLLGLALVHVSQLLLLVGLGELAAHATAQPSAVLLRAWAVLVPLAVFALLRARPTPLPRPLPQPA